MNISEAIEIMEMDGALIVLSVWGVIIGVSGCLAHYTIIKPSLKPKDFLGRFLMLMLSLHFGITFFRGINWLMHKYVF